MSRCEKEPVVYLDSTASFRLQKLRPAVSQLLLQPASEPLLSDLRPVELVQAGDALRDRGERAGLHGQQGVEPKDEPCGQAPGQQLLIALADVIA